MTSRSPIHDAHGTLGAVLAEWDGWEIPAHYGDPEGEYRSVREGVGRADRSHRTKFRVVGGDRVKFLQNILANEVQPLSCGEGTYTALLTDTGKIVADFRLAVLTEAILLDAEACCREEAFPNLDKYNLGYDCEILDETEDLGLLTLVGPKGPEVVAEVLGESPELDSPYRCREIDWQGEKVVCATTDLLGVPAVDLIVPVSALASLWEACGEVPAVGFSPLEVLRLEAGVPRFGADMDQSVNPMEAGLLNAISLDKGCYVGQEVVAKIESLGHVNRNLVGLRMEGETSPEGGTPLLAEGKKVGHVTSAARSPALGEVVALGYVHRKFSTPGQLLDVEVGGERRSARVSQRPLVS